MRMRNRPRSAMKPPRRVSTMRSMRQRSASQRNIWKAHLLRKGRRFSSGYRR